MLVRIVKDWGYPPNFNFFQQTPKGSGEWDGIEFTEERVETCDYLLVLRNVPYEIKVNCPIGNAWLINQEPPVKRYRSYTRVYKYFDRVFSYFNYPHPRLQSLQPLLPWFMSRSYEELKAIKPSHLDHKKEELVWITSSKNSMGGHKLRMRFKDYLQAKRQLHLLGKGFKPVDDKFDGLFPYQYAMAIENNCIKDYWTEKIADSYLSWCLPFYYGAPNLEDYFPAESFIRIDIHQPEEAVEIIEATIRNQEWKKRLGAIEKARKMLLDHHQFFPTVSRMIRDDEASSELKPIKKYRIPANPIPKYVTAATRVSSNLGDYKKIMKIIGLVK